MLNTSRRNFLSRSVLTTGGVLTAGFSTASAPLRELLTAIETASLSNNPFTTDEDFWHLVRQSYTVNPNLLNLNNGGVCPQPRVVQEAVERNNRLCNEGPSFYMWRILDAGREPLRQRLADLSGCSTEEIAIQRNSSEALETIIFGLQLQRGDEVILSHHDYPNMMHAWKQRELRDGIVLKWIDFEFPLEDADMITEHYVFQMTSRTKVVHVTQVINWNGQIMPVRKIADAAHARGIEVIVDGAHAFAHLDFTIPDLGCDYFGTSLHKWLCAPFGSGMLYVKKEKIAGLWPLFAAPDSTIGDIRKFEHLGTRSFAIEQAIGQAIDFHQMIGIQRKQARLFYLKNYWAEQALKLPGVSIGTSLKPEWSGALGLLRIENREPVKVAEYLYEKHKIHVVGIDWKSTRGVRITPNVYTLTTDLDRLIEAIEALLKT